MRSYTIRKIAGKPNWDEIPVMPIDTLLWTDSIDVTAQAQICWDEDGLYLRLEATEPNIRMEETELLAEVCNDSCLEFFLRPTQRLDYFNFEMNPNCALYLGFGQNMDTLIRLLLPDVQGTLNPKAALTDNGWVLTYRIPFAFIRRFFPEFEAKEGAKMYANAYKCGDETVKPHFLAWNPIDCDHPKFHCPEFFGTVILGGL